MEKHCFTKKIVLVFLLMIVLSVNVFAGSRDHDGGFFLRLSTGVGGAQAEYSDPSAMKLYGVSSDMNIAIGMMVLPNMALHATLYGWMLSEPTAEIGETSGEFPGDAALGSLGIGLTYYLMPANLYLSGSVGFSVMSVELLGTFNGETDAGPAFDVTLGKEWWVGGSWGLGVAGGFGYFSVPDKDVDENWSGFSLGVRFSATLN
jgi:hypothetical protein